MPNTVGWDWNPSKKSQAVPFFPIFRGRVNSAVRYLLSQAAKTLPTTPILTDWPDFPVGEREGGGLAW